MYTQSTTLMHHSSAIYYCLAPLYMQCKACLPPCLALPDSWPKCLPCLCPIEKNDKLWIPGGRQNIALSISQRLLVFELQT